LQFTLLNINIHLSKFQYSLLENIQYHLTYRPSTSAIGRRLPRQSETVLKLVFFVGVLKLTKAHKARSRSRVALFCAGNTSNQTKDNIDLHINSRAAI
ncbi:MAG: hypothetical protein LUP91_17365, partial [Methylococcaceae bacterium]|nr:hypothetical protein [Methylococcaceae bacterium]